MSKMKNKLEEMFPDTVVVIENGLPTLKPVAYKIHGQTTLCYACAQDLYCDKPYTQPKRFIVKDKIICENCGEAVEV